MIFTGIYDIIPRGYFYNLNRSKNERERERERERELPWAWKLTALTAFIGCFLYYYNVPLWGDDWFYGTIRDFQEIFTLKKAWHPGRHITEFLHIFPSRVLGPLLGFTLQNSLIGVRVIHGLTATVITLGLYWISSCYTPKPFRLYSALILGFSTIFLHKFFVEFTITSQLWGGMLFALIAGQPIAHFFLYGKLPSWFETKPHKFFGIWLAIIYCGTQVFDVCSWLIAGFSVCTLFYLYLNHQKISYPLKHFVKYLALTIIILAIFALIRNTILSEYGKSRLGGLNLSFSWFSNMLSPYTQASFWIGLFFLIKYAYVNILHRFSDTLEFYIFSLLFSGYFILGVSASIVGTYPDISIYFIWIALVNVFIQIHLRAKTMVYYFLPTLMLGLLIGTVNIFDATIYSIPVSRRTFISSRINERTIVLYQKAESDGKESLEIPESLADEMSLAFRVPSPWLGYMSIWMQMYGYTEKILPVVIVPD